MRILPLPCTERRGEMMELEDKGVYIDVYLRE
jgi:hypothetical protein